MPSKSRKRKPLELATCIAIESLSLARQPTGWNGGGNATRAAGIQHQRGGRNIGVTILRADVSATTGVVAIEHLSADFMNLEQSVQLATVAMHHGGQRWFFVCPVTGSHARKLYRYPGSGQFCSRRGLPGPVSYHCQRDAGAKRVMRQIWELRRRISAKGPLLGEFDKPDDMSDAEFIRKGRRYLQLANRLDLSTLEFRSRRNGDGYST